MISGRVKLRNYQDWKVYYFIQTDFEDAEEILERLDGLGCKSKFLRKADNLLHTRRLNIGLTYSNAKRRESVIVISKTTDIWEFLNSLAHETDHLEKHISDAIGFSPYSEDASYLVGEFIRGMFRDISRKAGKRRHCECFGDGHYICF